MALQTIYINFVINKAVDTGLLFNHCKGFRLGLGLGLGLSLSFKFVVISPKTHYTFRQPLPPIPNAP